MMVQVKHILAMEYSAAELRLWALEDILSGPDHLHRDLGSKLGEMRAYRSEQDDAKVVSDPMGFPGVKRLKPPKRGKEPTAPRGPVGRVVTPRPARSDNCSVTVEQPQEPRSYRASQGRQMVAPEPVRLGCRLDCGRRGAAW